MPRPPLTQLDPQQNPMQRSYPLFTQSRTSISPRPFPSINLNNTVPLTPSTPSVHIPSNTHGGFQSKASPFQPQNKLIVQASLRKPDGPPNDIMALAAEHKSAAKAEKETVLALEQPRRPTSVPTKTELAKKEHLDEEQKEELLALLKARRDAEAAKRKRLDDAERERRKREKEERERKEDEEVRQRHNEERRRAASSPQPIPYSPFQIYRPTDLRPYAETPLNEGHGDQGWFRDACRGF
jgi:hypothetical protein